MKYNKELCKLLGIKPKIKVHCLDCQKNYDDNYEFGNNRCYSNCSETLIRENHINKTIEEIYPDFTKPANFVKLLETVVNIDDFTLKIDRDGYVLKLYYGFEFYEKTLTDSLIYFLTDDFNIADNIELRILNRLKDELKQQMQAVNWE